MQEDPAPNANHAVTELARLLPLPFMFASASLSGAFFVCAHLTKECGEYHV